MGLSDEEHLVGKRESTLCFSQAVQ